MSQSLGIGNSGKNRRSGGAEIDVVISGSPVKILDDGRQDGRPQKFSNFHFQRLVLELKPTKVLHGKCAESCVRRTQRTPESFNYWLFFMTGYKVEENYQVLSAVNNYRCP